MSGREEAAAEAFRRWRSARMPASSGCAACCGRRCSAAIGMPRRPGAEAETAQPGAAWLREERAAARAAHPRLAGGAGAAGARPAARGAGAGRRGAGARPGEGRRAGAPGLPGRPAFAPAALAHAKRLRHGGSPRRARGVLEEAWAAAPHPDLAEPYLAEEPDRPEPGEGGGAAGPPQPDACGKPAAAGPRRAGGRADRPGAQRAGGAGGSGRGRPPRLSCCWPSWRRPSTARRAEARAAQARWLREAAGGAARAALALRPLRHRPRGLGAGLPRLRHGGADQLDGGGAGYGAGAGVGSDRRLRHPAATAAESRAGRRKGRCPLPAPRVSPRDPGPMGRDADLAQG